MDVYTRMVQADDSSRHKADMLSAAAVNKTFISPDVIKWNGFQVIGDTLLSVLQCQHYPYYSIKHNDAVERAILETPDVSEQVFFNYITQLICRIWTQNLMNSSHRRNDLTRNHNQLDHSGFPRPSIDGRNRGELVYIICFWIRWIWLGYDLVLAMNVPSVGIGELFFRRIRFGYVLCALGIGKVKAMSKAIKYDVSIH